MLLHCSKYGFALQSLTTSTFKYKIKYKKRRKKKEKKTSPRFLSSSIFGKTHARFRESPVLLDVIPIHRKISQCRRYISSPSKNNSLVRKKREEKQVKVEGDLRKKNSQESKNANTLI